MLPRELSMTLKGTMIIPPLAPSAESPSPNNKKAHGTMLPEAFRKPAITPPPSPRGQAGRDAGQGPGLPAVQRGAGAAARREGRVRRGEAGRGGG
jgi:hypothetical protein